MKEPGAAERHRSGTRTSATSTSTARSCARRGARSIPPTRTRARCASYAARTARPETYRPNLFVTTRADPRHRRRDRARRRRRRLRHHLVRARTRRHHRAPRPHAARGRAQPLDATGAGARSRCATAATTRVCASGPARRSSPNNGSSRDGDPLGSPCPPSRAVSRPSYGFDAPIVPLFLCGWGTALVAVAIVLFVFVGVALGRRTRVGSVHAVSGLGFVYTTRRRQVPGLGGDPAGDAVRRHRIGARPRVRPRRRPRTGRPAGSRRTRRRSGPLAQRRPVRQLAAATRRNLELAGVAATDAAHDRRLPGAPVS